MNDTLQAFFTNARDFVAGIFLVLGVLLCLVGSFGVIRFPDFYTRMQAAGVTDCGGTLLIVVGLGILGGWSFVTAKLILIALFLLVTIPTTRHLLAQAAHSAGLEPIIGRRTKKLEEANPTDSAAGGRSK